MKMKSGKAVESGGQGEEEEEEEEEKRDENRGNGKERVFIA